MGGIGIRWKYTTAPQSGFLRARGLPRLRILPASVGCVVEVQQQAFATVEKSEPEDVVPQERELRNDEDIADESRPGAAHLTRGNQQGAAERAVPVHVLDVGFQRRVGVVDQIVIERGAHAVEGDGLVNRPVLEAGWVGKVGGGAAKQAQFGVGIETALLDPASQEEITALQVVGVGGRIAWQQRPDLILQLRAELLVGVERQNPGSEEHTSELQ